MADVIDSYKKMLADPVIEHVLRASKAMPDSQLVRTIPLGELLQFARAVLLRTDESGVTGTDGKTL